MRRSATIVGSVTVAVVVLVGALLGVVLGLQPAIAVGLLVACAITTLAVPNPIVALAASVFLAFTVSGLVYAGLIPASAALVSDYVLLVTAASTMAAAALRKTARWPLLAFPLLFALLAALVSAFANGVSPLVALLGVRAFFRYSLLYVAIVMIEPERIALRRLVWLLVAFAFTQVPFAVLQFLGPGRFDPDAVIGTLGQGMSGVLTVWLLFMIGFIYRVQIARVVQGGLLARLAPVLLFVPIALNSTTIAFVFGPVVAVWLFLFSRIRRRRGRIAILSVLMVAAMAVTYSVYLGSGGLSLTDSQAVSGYVTTRYANGDSGGRLTRLPMAAYAVQLVSRDPVTVLLGYGPGAASNRSLAGVAGSLVAADPVVGKNDTFFSSMTLELGVAGWIAIGLLVAGTVRMNNLGRRLALSGDARAVMDFTIFLAVAQVPLSLYTNVWTANAMAASFWLFAGVSECLLRSAGRPPP